MGDIPAPWGRHAVLQRALQKTPASVPFKEVHKIAADISVLEGLIHTNIQSEVVIKWDLKLSLQNCIWV